MSSGRVKCTCGWSWNKSDSSKKDVYICHECGRDNSNNMKNGGWLDNYNESSVSVPKGMVGEGYSTKGRNYSPAWGGQFQMGGYVYPVNYVPEAQMGTSIPGAVGFTYARTNSPAPSNGKYAKKTMASAQKGRTITVDEGDGKKRKILTDSKEYADLYNEGRIGVKNDDESISFNPLNEVVVTPYDKQYPFYQELSDEEKKYFNSDTPIGRQLRSRAQDNVGFNADKAADFAMGWLRDLPLSAVQAPQSALVEGVEAIRGNESSLRNVIEPEKQRVPSDVWGIENDYYTMIPTGLPGSFMPVNLKTVGNTAMDIVTDPLLIEGLARQPLQQGLKKAGRALGTESGLLSNAYKYNPWAFKPNESNYYRQVSKEAIDDALSSKLIREKGEVVSLENYKNFQNQLEDLAGTKEYLNHEDKYRAMYNNSHGPMPYFQKGELFYGDKPLLKVREKGTPMSERRTVKLDHLIESNYSPENFQNSYGYKMSLGNPDEVGAVGILKPDPSLRDLENFNLYKKDWLQGYKQIPKQEDGGVIKDDLGQWAHPGEITEIGSNQITMEGVPYNVLGISDTGDTKLMKPGKNYKFKGKKVTEYPMAKNGIRQEQKGLVNLDQLTNFTNYNTKQPGGWLDNY